MLVMTERGAPGFRPPVLLLEARGDLIWESCSEISVALKAEAFPGEKKRKKKKTNSKYTVIFDEKTRIISGRMILTEGK